MRGAAGEGGQAGRQQMWYGRHRQHHGTRTRQWAGLPGTLLGDCGWAELTAVSLVLAPVVVRALQCMAVSLQALPLATQALAPETSCLRSIPAVVAHPCQSAAGQPRQGHEGVARAGS